MATGSVTQVEGMGIAIRGNDIDTDRIIPARFLRMITFEGLGKYAFEDDRKSNPDHPFNNDRYQGASLLLANGNFGCGSSREHAPQALTRWGIKAIVSESFAEIFQGNCTAMGIPCVTASPLDVARFQDHIEANPTEPLTLDLIKKTLSSADLSILIELPEGNRKSLLEGAWDATGMLLEGAGAVKETAESLPYVKGF
ncbi:MAG: 3-isopropylmalate dehydratase small subunit [Candidatus Latescibacterota bacterium]|nr:3-isopropylmalate dehydratase small subunit [Candidatus Latescibacterota bacterium]